MVILHKACSTVPGTQSTLAVFVVNTPIFQMKTVCDAQGRTLELKETQLSSFMDKKIFPYVVCLFMKKTSQHHSKDL